MTGAFRRRPAAGVMAVSLNQTIVFWDRKAREMLGYTAERLEVKCFDVRLVVVPWLPGVGTVVVYLFRERVANAGLPVGDLVVVEQDDGADPRALSEPHVQPLTPRELEVLRLMALGSEHEYIAVELEVTLHTVRFHVANLRRKLNAKPRFEAVMTATRLGILSLGDRSVVG